MSNTLLFIGLDVHAQSITIGLPQTAAAKRAKCLRRVGAKGEKGEK